MKEMFKKALHGPVGSISRRLFARVDSESINQQIQLSLTNQWIQWRIARNSPYTKIREAGFRCYSQFEEDGIILYMLTMIGVKAGTVVEMCCGTGNECMATNLILNHGYSGFLFDGSAENIAAAASFFASKKDCLLLKPKLKTSWITVENVNQLLIDSSCPKDVDLFSLDIDGNDYWVWEAIDEIRPKICCFETSDYIPSDRSLTIPYDPNFDCWSQPPALLDFRSVSLAAMVKLSKRKGYRLIGSHRHGFNVFFMRNDIGTDFFPEVSIQEVHDNPWTKEGQIQRWNSVKDLNWIEV
jgi:hypothetical protein